MSIFPNYMNIHFLYAGTLIALQYVNISSKLIKREFSELNISYEICI